MNAVSRATTVPEVVNALWLSSCLSSQRLFKLSLLPRHLEYAESLNLRLIPSRYRLDPVDATVLGRPVGLEKASLVVPIGRGELKLSTSSQPFVFMGSRPRSHRHSSTTRLAAHCESQVFAPPADRRRFQQAQNAVFLPFSRVYSLGTGLAICPIFGREKRIRKFIFPFCWFSGFAAPASAAH